MEEPKKIFIIAGEPSGDLHAANLVKALKSLDSALDFIGVGGNLMQEAGVKIYYDIKEISALGLFNILMKLPKFFKLKKIILKKIDLEKPKCIILVDFSGFNLRLAKKINKRIPIIYYISPQVWASRRGRIKTIKKYISKLICILKFEEEFYQRYGLKVDFVGHPLVDIVYPKIEKEAFLKENGISSNKTTILLLPGSRKSEIKHILPIMLKVSKLLKEKIKEIQFIITKPKDIEERIYQQQILKYKNDLDLKIITNRTYDCLNVSDFCLVASGTATLETALMQKPFVIIYKTNLLNYLLYRPQIKVPYIGMVNILANKMIIPEFIQFRASPKKIAQKIIEILKNPLEIERIKNDLLFIKSSLGEKGASYRAAKIILDFLK